MSKVLAENRRAHFDFEIIEKLVAGIVLTGHETKSVKMGRVQIAGAHIIVRDEEVFILGMEIPSFQPKNAPQNHYSGRTKKLLLNRKEIASLIGKIKEGYSVIPLKVFDIKNKVKIEIALARGLKKRDKRELLKKRESEREMKKAIS